MNKETFVEVLKEVVLNQSINDTLENLIKPPGRKPSDDLIKMSTLFNSLSIVDKEILTSIISTAAESSLFGFLCVLDGIRAIEDGEEKGDLELFYSKGGKKILINDSNDDYLHDLI